MKDKGALISGTRMLRLVLPLALVLLIGHAHAEPPSDAKCTGKPGAPWSEQIAACSMAIESGRMSGNDLAKTLLSRANAYGQTGDMDRSLADVEQAIRVDPAYPEAFGARGDLHLVKKDYPGAIADYTTSIAMDHTSAQAFTGRGMAYFATGAFDRAITDFDQSLRLRPNYALALYWRGFAKQRKGDTTAGEADIAEAKKIDPEIEQ